MNVRSLVAVALLVPAVAFAAPSSKKSAAKPEASTSSRTSGTALDGLEVGGFIGYETDDVSGLSLRFDAELPFRQLSPQIKMSFVGSLGFNYLTDSSFAGNVDLKTYSLYVVPAARFTMQLNEQFSVFGDAGIGLAYVHGKIDFPAGPFYPADYTDSTINLMMRLGVGAWYHVNPQLKLGAMLEFDPVFGDYAFSGATSQSFFLIQVGAMFRL